MRLVALSEQTTKTFCESAQNVILENKPRGCTVIKSALFTHLLSDRMLDLCISFSGSIPSFNRFPRFRLPGRVRDELHHVRLIAHSLQLEDRTTNMLKPCHKGLSIHPCTQTGPCAQNTAIASIESIWVCFHRLSSPSDHILEPLALAKATLTDRIRYSRYDSAGNCNEAVCV